MNKVLLLFTVFLLSGCISEPDQTEVGEVDGLKPIYVTEENNVIEVQSARPFNNLGKIVYAAPFILINERNLGIHILDNTDPVNPIKIAFIQIPGNTDFTLKNGFWYANHGSDLKTFEIAPDALSTGLELLNIIETDSIPHFFADEESSAIASLFPANYEGFFECVDPEKGIVIGWEETTLFNPECKI